MARTKKGRDIHGVFLLDKAQGMSSNAIMQRVKHLFNAKKAGHTGALDPLATGMLPICLGEATKFAQAMLKADKRYLVTAKLGERTDTSDADGKIVQIRPVNCDLNAIHSTLPYFRGELLQVPTMFSALKYQGKPLYEYARQGIQIEREGRPITIFELKFIDWQSPFLTLEIHCSKGTYIRTLIDDLGEHLGCGAHVTMLRRLAVADFKPTQMLTLAKLEAMKAKLPAEDFSELDALLLPIDSCIARLAPLHLTAEQTHAIQFGQRVKFENSQNLNGQVRLFTSDNYFLGIAEIDNDIIMPKRLVMYAKME